MNTTVSNANNRDEQDVKEQGSEDNLLAMFNAAYSGNDEESSRLHSEAAESEEDESETTPDETNEEVDAASGIDIASTDLATTSTTEETPNESTDELASLKQELHRAKSDAGRLPHMQRRVQELERELTKLRTPASKPDNDEVIPAKLKERIERLKEIDPDLAELIETSHSENAAATRELAAAYERSIKLQQEREEAEYVSREYDKVISAVPEAEEVFRSPEWSRWVGMLSPNHRAMAESSDANEVLTALAAFKVDATNYFGGYKWGDTTTTSKPEPQVSPSVRAAENSRANRLASSATVKPAAARATTELDLEDLFKQAFDNEIAANRPS